MVAQAGGYYRETFCRERGVTHSNPLLPTIFNVVVGAVVRHWESLVEEWVGVCISKDKGNIVQTAWKKILVRDNDRRRSEEGHTSLMVKAALCYADY